MIRKCSAIFLYAHVGSTFDPQQVTVKGLGLMSDLYLNKAIDQSKAQTYHLCHISTLLQLLKIQMLTCVWGGCTETLVTGETLQLGHTKLSVNGNQL